MTYRESLTAVPGAVLWQRTVAVSARTPILPDGCLDLIWDGSRLFVAGPGSGYADQAHLTREVRALTGTPPTRLLGELAAR